MEAELSVDGELVTEGECGPGQVIRFGESVEIEILRELKDPAEPSMPGESSEAEEMQRCVVWGGDLDQSNVRSS